MAPPLATPPDPTAAPALGLRRMQVAVFLVALSGLILEIGLTRIFSATIWYHFAFVAVSVALLGWGLGGFLAHAFRRRLPPSTDRAALLVLLGGLAVPLCLAVIVRIPFHVEAIAAYFVFPLLPFFLCGTALAMLFDLNREVAPRLYFADLLGASGGAVVVAGLLSWLGGEATVLASAVAAALAAAVLSRRLRPIAALACVVMVAAVVTQRGTGMLSVRAGASKAMHRHMKEQPGATIAHTGWNAFSRIDVVEGFPPPGIARLYIDSDAWTNIVKWDGDPDSVRTHSRWFRAFPFSFFSRPKTLVIGPGGGSDVVVAIGSGSEKVTAVELNPLVLEFVRAYRERAGNLYDHPLVETVLSEGRSFISRTDRRFDVIFLGFVDSWASVASGGLSLSENYLYTVEAFKAYYEHLSDDGVLVMLRWDVDIARMVANSVALLGPTEAQKRVAVLLESTGDPPQMLFMLRKRPFTEAETAAMMAWGKARPVIVPGRHAEPPYGELLSGQKSWAAYEASAADRVNPVYDDSPFFFARYKPWGMPKPMAEGFGFLLVPVAVLLAVLVGLGRPRGSAVVPYVGSVLHFAALGLGFIVVELALLQHLTLLLGHPAFTLSLLLFVLLAAGGLGSRLGARLPSRWVAAGIAAAAAALALALPDLVPALLPLPLAARIACAVALLVPLGFAMGIPFPQGLSRVGQGGLPAAPFYWGINGVLSVVGSVGTVACALLYGFQAAMLCGAALYALAAVTALPRPGSQAGRDLPSP